MIQRMTISNIKHWNHKGLKIINYSGVNFPKIYANLCKFWRKTENLIALQIITSFTCTIKGIRICSASSFSESGLGIASPKMTYTYLPQSMISTIPVAEWTTLSDLLAQITLLKFNTRVVIPNVAQYFIILFAKFSLLIATRQKSVKSPF